MSHKQRLQLGPIYQLSSEEERLLILYLNKMIKEGKIHPSSGMVGSPVLFLPEPNGQGIRLCVDWRHLNVYMKEDRTPLPIIVELQNHLAGANFVMKIDMESGFHLIRMALGHERFTAFRTNFGLYQYLVIALGLTNVPATIQREVNRIL